MKRGVLQSCGRCLSLLSSAGKGLNGMGELAEGHGLGTGETHVAAVSQCLKT